MRMTFYLLATSALALLSAAPAFPVELLVDDPSIVVKAVTNLLADGKPDEAAETISKFIIVTPTSQFNFDKLALAFRTVTKPGKAEFEDEILNAKFGNSVQNIIEYLHFPSSDDPGNQFVFLKFTFLWATKGWQLTNFSYTAGGQFPPPGWNLEHGS
jgi:hypothetical protein